jgi:hypothetical protein
VGGALRLPGAVAGDACRSGQAGQAKRHHEKEGQVRFLGNPGPGNRDHSVLGRSLAGCRRPEWAYWGGLAMADTTELPFEQPS